MRPVVNRVALLVAGTLAGAIAVYLIADRATDDKPSTDTTAAPAAEGVIPLVRADSQRISTAPTDAIAFVEFLDFECEACRAAHPAIEELRTLYGDRVSFVVRNFPLHRNSEAAARAAEAAASQGRYIEMMDILFARQPEWGERTSSQEALFFGFAEQLGLDMVRFRQVYDSPATINRIRRDKAEGQALGVSGTPTFFLGGEKLQPSSFEDLVTAIDLAIGS